MRSWYPTIRIPENNHLYTRFYFSQFDEDKEIYFAQIIRHLYHGNRYGVIV